MGAMKMKYNSFITKPAFVLIGVVGLALILYLLASIANSKRQETTLQAVKRVVQTLQEHSEYALLEVEPHTSPAIVILGPVPTVHDSHRLKEKIETMRLPRRTFATLYTGELNKATMFIRWEVPPVAPEAKPSKE
jgi:hypothetical protein